MRRFVKVLVFLIALSPAASVVTLTVTDILGKTHALGANPIDTLTDTTGIWTLRFVLLSLAITPLRRLTGWNALIRFRRMLGLFAFFYGTLHFTTWIGLDQVVLWPYILPEAGPDQAVTWELILRDIAKRPYITVGFTGFVLMIPLAHHLDGRLDPPARRTLVEPPAPPRLRHRRLRRRPLPLAGEGGRGRADHLRGDPGGAAGTPCSGGPSPGVSPPRPYPPAGRPARQASPARVTCSSGPSIGPPGAGRSQAREVPIEVAVLHDAEPPAIAFIA